MHTVNIQYLSAFRKAILLLAILSTRPCTGDPSGIAEIIEPHCASFSPASTDSGTRALAECILVAGRSGNVRQVDAAKLKLLVDPFYVQVAKDGERIYADAIRVIVEEIERRSPLNEGRDDIIYSALLLSGQIAEAEVERKNKEFKTTKHCDSSDV